MDLVNDILSYEFILNEFKKIDDINPYPCNHGLKHVYGLLNIIDNFAKEFKLSNRECLILKVCAIFHDIGQTEGRKNHGLRSAEFMRKYLISKNAFSDDELNIMYSAVLTHDEYMDYNLLQNDYSWHLNLLDKLDFSRSRLEDNYLKRFDYSVFSDINRILINKEGNIFKIIIQPIKNPKIISSEKLFEKNLFNKGMKIFKIYCDHFSMVPKVYLGKSELDINNINTSLIFDK